MRAQKKVICFIYWFYSVFTPYRSLSCLCIPAVDLWTRFTVMTAPRDKVLFSTLLSFLKAVLYLKLTNNGARQWQLCVEVGSVSFVLSIFIFISLSQLPLLSSQCRHPPSWAASLKLWTECKCLETGQETDRPTEWTPPSAIGANCLDCRGWNLNMINNIFCSVLLLSESATSSDRRPAWDPSEIG